jgi:hypothetical protein
MTTKEPMIKIPIGDWVQEYDQLEVDVSTEEALIQTIASKQMSTIQAARLAIVARERGAAPAEMLPPNKLLLNTGGAMDIQGKIARRYKEVQLTNGSTVKVREFVAPVREHLTEEPDEEDQTTEQLNRTAGQLPEDTGIVEAVSEIAHKRAYDYLLQRVPGYIYSRLKLIAANKGDVTEAANALKKEIDEMVTKLR